MLKQIEPERLHGDACWGHGYAMFPLLLIELEEHLFTMLPLPHDVHPELLIGIASAQARANDLPMRLCSGTVGFNFLTQDWATELRVFVHNDRVILNALQLPCELPVREEQQRELQRFVRDHQLTRPYFGGGPPVYFTNRRAYEHEADLTGYDEYGVPRACARCGKCGEYAGAYVTKTCSMFGTPNAKSVARTIYCRCANTNRCARCGQLLAERKLRACYYDVANCRIAYMSGLHAVAHQCQAEPMDWAAQQMEEWLEREVRQVKRADRQWK
jgi:hypothetical protein